jgi:hypothetical protein
MEVDGGAWVWGLCTVRWEDRQYSGVEWGGRWVAAGERDWTAPCGKTKKHARSALTWSRLRRASRSSSWSPPRSACSLSSSPHGSSTTPIVMLCPVVARVRGGVLAFFDKGLELLPPSFLFLVFLRGKVAHFSSKTVFRTNCFYLLAPTAAHITRSTARRKR